MKYEILAPFIVALLRSRGRGDRSDIEPYQELQFAYGEAWLQIEDSCDMGRVPDGRCKHVTPLTTAEHQRIRRPLVA